MFVFNRSALAVVLPLALLAGAVFWSNRTPVGTDVQTDVRVAAVQEKPEIRTP